MLYGSAFQVFLPVKAWMKLQPCLPAWMPGAGIGT